jgi:hypothetical protein
MAIKNSLHVPKYSKKTRYMGAARNSELYTASLAIGIEIQKDNPPALAAFVLSSILQANPAVASW